MCIHDTPNEPVTNPKRTGNEPRTNHQNTAPTEPNHPILAHHT